MPVRARICVGIVLTIGAIAIVGAFHEWDGPKENLRLYCYLALAIVASCLKVKLPRVTGTVSVLFVVLIAGIVELSLAEVLLIGIVSVVTQSIWHARVRPHAVQVMFSIAAVALATTAGHFLYGHIPFVVNPFRILIAGAIYFLINTFLIATIISLTEGKLICEVWRTCYFWTFPYHLVGAALIGAFTNAQSAIDWRSCAIIVPVFFIVHRTYHVYMNRLEAEQKHAEAERKHAIEIEQLHNQAMESLDKELRVKQLQSDFVSAVSHEFRTPLTAVRAITELLAQGRITDDARRVHSYVVIEREVDRLQKLVEDLLDFGSMESGSKQYRIQSYQLADIVALVVDNFREDARASGFTIEVNRDEAKVVIVNVDKDALGCALRNLLENAIKYSPECQTIWVDLSVQESNAVVSVRDRGIGIHPDEHRYIFQKFVRGDAAKKAGIKGTGIGLSMVAQIIHGMGGQVRVESAVGVGSTFTILLPLVSTEEGHG
jgi:signal transduction histidine kinase